MEKNNLHLTKCHKWTIDDMPEKLNNNLFKGFDILVIKKELNETF